jgi:hypothetical protein
MADYIGFQPISIATNTADRDGRLVLADGKLVAVLVRLADEVHPPELLGSWFVEAAFGDLSDLSGNATFATLEEAADRLGNGLTGDRWEHVAPAIALSVEGD